jgi:hypothetical protein
LTVTKNLDAFGKRVRPFKMSVPQFLTAAALSAAVVFSLTGFAHGQSERFPAGPADMFKPGAVFLYYDGTADPGQIEGLNTTLNIMTAQSAEVAATMATVRAGIDKGVAESNRDTLAYAVATSIEGTFTVLVQARFLRALSQNYLDFDQTIETTRTNIHLPDGESIELPAFLAAAVHLMKVVAAGKKMRTKGPARNLTGRYDLQTTGTCSVPDGHVAIGQKDFVIEGANDDRLLLFGALGETRIYMVSNEQRFARIASSVGGSPQIEVPDTPSDLFEAALPPDGMPIEFQSTTRGTCSFTLTLASP